MDVPKIPQLLRISHQSGYAMTGHQSLLKELKADPTGGPNY
jgi:hypothetical protein